MTLRDSLDLIKAVSPEGGMAVLEHELMAERVSSLNAAEARVAKTLAAMRENKTPDTLADAQEAVWLYFVQREMIGFKGHQDVIREFDIPKDVINGLGAKLG